MTIVSIELGIGGQVERDFGGQSEKEKPEAVAEAVAGVQETLRNQEAENREGNASDGAGKIVGSEVVRADFEKRNETLVIITHDVVTDMVNRHGDDGNEFHHAAAENAVFRERSD